MTRTVVYCVFCLANTLRLNMILRLTILLVIYCTTLPSFAMTVHNLNTANIAITKEVSGAELNDLFQQGLQQALIKTSGNPGITSLTGIQSAIANAKNWVTSYSFKKVVNQSTISITYNQKSIDNLLQKNNQGSWGNNRPLTLIWIKSIKSGLISAHQSDNQYQAITQTADGRGLPILLPPETANQHYSSDRLNKDPLLFLTLKRKLGLKRMNGLVKIML